MELRRLTLLTFCLIIIAIVTVALLSSWSVNEVLQFINTSKSGLNLIAGVRKIQAHTNELLITEDISISYIRWRDALNDFSDNLTKFKDSPKISTLIRDKTIASRYSAFLILSERALNSLKKINREYEFIHDKIYSQRTGLFINSRYGRDKYFTEVANHIRQTGSYFSLTYEKTISSLITTLDTESKNFQKIIILVSALVTVFVIILTLTLLYFIRREEDRIKNDKLNVEMRMNKFELLKYFAGGIAHDFNNYLAAIFGNISIAKTYVKPGEELSEILNDVENASEQAIGLTKQFMAFAKGDSSNKRVIDVEDTIKNTASFVLRGSSIKCEYNFPSNLNNIEIDKSRFCEVINNILINSMQALPNGGVIRISATNTYLKKARSNYFTTGKYVHIEISDNGPGIPANIREKVFNPFFTTKKKGSGLGLAICYSIVQENHGYINFESEKDKGTTFHVYLKASTRAIESKTAETSGFKRGSGKILLMDDDEKILITVSRMLKQLGYTPEIVVEGKAAVKKYIQAREDNAPFKAVILDYTIPGGSGAKETLIDLMKFDKNVIAVISSGYSIDTIMPDYLDIGFSAYLKKGYTIQELGKVLSDLLPA